MKPFTITSVDWHINPEDGWEVRSDFGQLYLVSPTMYPKYNLTELGLVDHLKEVYPELFIDIQPLEPEIPF